MKNLLPMLLGLLTGCLAPALTHDAGEADLDAGPDDAGEVRDAGGDDGGFGWVLIEDWCQSRAWAVCHRDLRCLRLSPGRLGDCLQRERESCDQPAYTRGVAEGRLQYLATQGGSCLNAYAQGRCEGTPAQCEGLFQGLTPPDGGCLLSEECTPQGFCYRYSGTCPFRCQPFRGLDQYCDDWLYRCDPAHYTCQQRDGGPRVCRPPLGAGEACNFEECRADLTCASGACVKRRAQVGETCGEVGAYPLCESDAFCRQPPSPPGGGPAPPGTCQKRVGLGGVCTGYGSCLPNLRCSSNYATGTCVPLGAENETCTGSGECQKELFCLAQSASCLPLPTEGGDCTAQGSSYTCAAGHFCDFAAPDQQYRCAPKLAEGAPCSYDSSCQSNLCEYGPLEDGGYGSRCRAACSVRADGGF